MGKLNIRKERYSSPLALEPKWKENLRRITRKINKVDTATRQQRYAMKGILYRKPKDTNKINDKCQRLNPKIWLMVLGFVIFTLSAFSAFTHLVSDDILKIALPWALGLKGVPLWLDVIGIICGTWMFCTHPMRYHGHGILNIKQRTSSADTHELDMKTFEKKYSDLYSAIQSILKIECIADPKSMMITEMRGMDRLIEAVSCGYVDMSFSPYHCSHTAGSRMIRRFGLSQTNIRDINDRYDDAVGKISDISQIWESESLGLGGVRIPLYSLEEREVEILIDKIRALGDKLCLESAIETYMSGVPVEDVIA